MNIRPIDLQVMIPHATDIGKVQATQNHQQVIQQQQFAEQMQRQVEAQQGQVQGALRVEMPRVHREKQETSGGHAGSDQSGKRDAKHREKEGTHADQGKDGDPVRGHKIDIVS